MRSKILCFIFCAIALPFWALAQLDTIRLDTTLSFKNIAVDEVGFIYGSSKDVLIKFDAQGKIRYVFSDKRNGKIDHFDVQNPLKTLVYYNAMMVAKILDNTLSERGETLQLSRKGYSLVPAAAISNIAGIWFFDQLNFELLRMDENGNLKARSGNLLQVLGENLSPLEIKEGNQRVYVRTDAAIYVFDIYGTFVRKVPIEDVKLMCIHRNGFFFTTDYAHIAYYDAHLNEIKAIGEVQKGFTALSFSQDKLYFGYSNFILSKKIEGSR